MKKHSQMARFKFALVGLLAAWKQEASFRTEVYIFLAGFGFMAWRRPALYWWLAMTVSAALVLVAELINTAIENVCDALHPSRHPMIGAAKDCASAAVLVANLMALALFAGTVISLWR